MFFKNKYGIQVYLEPGEAVALNAGYLVSSVLDIIKTFEKVNNVKVNYKIVDRRPGDIASSYADVTKSYKELGFKTIYTLEDMCKDAYNFAIKNDI